MAFSEIWPSVAEKLKQLVADESESDDDVESLHGELFDPPLEESDGAADFRSRDCAHLKVSRCDGDSARSQGQGEGQMPSVCRDYNCGHCSSVNCEKLHVCYYWVRDRCLYENVCAKKHCIDTLSQCALSALGWHKNNFHKAFLAMKKAYVSGTHPQFNTVKVCLDYSTSQCRNSCCERFHVCHGSLLGNCNDSRVCHLLHDVLSRGHNAQLADKMGLSSRKELRKLLKKSLANIQVCPCICDEYNTRRGCQKIYCNQLHCCKIFALYGLCRFKRDCYKTHALESNHHNRAVMSRFGLTGGDMLALLRERCQKSQARDNRPPTAQAKLIENLEKNNQLLEKQIQLLRLNSLPRW